MLGDHVVMGIYLLPGPREKYSLPLAFALGLHDERLVLYLRFLLNDWLRPLLLLFLLLGGRSSSYGGLYRLLFCLSIGGEAILLLLVLDFSFTRFFDSICSSDFTGGSLCRLSDFLLNGFFFRLFFHKLSFEQIHFMRQDKSCREEVVVFWVLFSHQSQVLPQLVFMCDDSYAWPLWHPLIRSNFIELIRSNLQVEPTNIELLRMILSPRARRHFWKSICRLIIPILWSGLQARINFALSIPQLEPCFGHNIVNSIPSVDYELLIWDYFLLAWALIFNFLYLILSI